MEALEATLFGIIGALLGEFVKQSQKIRSMSNDDFKLQFSSIKFWILASGLILAGGTISYALFKDSAGQLSILSCLVAGAGSMSFLRNAGSAWASRQVEDFANATLSFKAKKQKITWREILR